MGTESQPSQHVDGWASAENEVGTHPPGHRTSWKRATDVTVGAGTVTFSEENLSHCVWLWFLRHDTRNKPPERSRPSGLSTEPGELPGHPQERKHAHGSDHGQFTDSLPDGKKINGPSGQLA